MIDAERQVALTEHPEEWFNGVAGKSGERAF